jgi:hypothetical protein
MRKTVISFTLVFLLTIVGCSDDPRKTAQLFFENLGEGKISEAKKYGTGQTGDFIDMAVSIGDIPFEPDVKFIFVSQTIEGNEAVVRYQEKEGGKVETMNLVKIDGQWKVSLKK